MSGSFADSNVVIYSFDTDPDKRRKALNILAKKPVISVQVLNESANVMRRKLGFEVATIRRFFQDLIPECRIHPLSPSTVMAGLDIAERYGFSHYDSVIVATALAAGCTVLYSEDMQHGQVIDGRLMIVNPFR